MLLHRPWQAALGLQAAGVTTEVAQVAPGEKMEKHCMEGSEECHWNGLAIQ